MIRYKLTPPTVGGAGHSFCSQVLATDTQRRRSGLFPTDTETVTRRRPRFPAKPEIADFGFEALDLKPKRAACRKYEIDKARRRRCLFEGDVQEVENERFVPVTKAAARDS